MRKKNPSSRIEQGDVFEVLEDAKISVFSASNLPSVLDRAYVDLKEGDYITYVGARRFGVERHLVYKFILNPVDVDGELTDIEYPFYVKRIASFFERIGYEVSR